MTQNSKTGFLDRALGNLRDAWRGIAGAAYDDATHPDLPEGHAKRLREQLRACLETLGGEVSARARAAVLGHAYLALGTIGRERFLTILGRDFGVNGNAVDRAVADLDRATGIKERHRAGQALRKTL